MEPIDVTVDEDGKVTVIIDLKNGKRGELELPFDLAKDLLMKLRSRLESFENRRGLIAGTTSGGALRPFLEPQFGACRQDLRHLIGTAE